jgi:catechol 2,3-dioxygenase-like lactoylglutathione lyase family enzyme
MLDHIGLAVSDLDRSRAFYEAALAPIGLVLLKTQEHNDVGGRVVMFGPAGGEPELVIADGERPGEGNHVAFRVEDEAQVDAFHAAALAAGGRDNGAPGIRAKYAPDYYAAFVFDPDGFNIEAVCYLDRVS